MSDCKIFTSHKYLEKIVYAVIAVLSGTLVYALDWQRDQDKVMANYASQIQEQRTLNQELINFNKLLLGIAMENPPTTVSNTVNSSNNSNDFPGSAGH